jgi:transposase InsO family protein
MMSLPYKAGIGRLCGLFGMTRQAWYEHRWGADDRCMREEEILELVKAHRMDGRFGARTLLGLMSTELAERGIQIGRDRLLDLLRDRGLLVRPLRRHVSTTNSSHHYRKWPYLLEGLGITQAEQVWVCDITYIRSNGGFLYLFLVTDAYSHKVMGFHLSHTMEARGAVAALKMAISQRIYPERELIHHSDRGVQYCSANYVKVLQDAGISISMTEGASPHQNTIAERINRTFKEQLYMDQVFVGYHQALARMVEAVKVYNHVRPHSSSSNLTPEEAHKASEPLKRTWKSYKPGRKSAEALAGLHTSRQV